MAKQRLVIEGNDQGPFFLSIDAGTVTVGGSARSAEALLRDLHVLRIHCELEVAEEHVVVGNPRAPAGLPGRPPAGQELQPGKALQVGHAQLLLEAAETEPAAEGEPDLLPQPLREESAESPARPTAEPPSAAPLPDPTLGKRLLVIDGADQGQKFPLPETGTVTVGKNKRHADVILNDLYVSRVQCELHCGEDGIVVVHLAGSTSPTMINGQPVTRQAIGLGDVLRVGNSHLRLESTIVQDGPARIESDDYEIIEDDEQPTAPAEPAQPAEVPAEPFALPHSPVDALLELEEQTLGHFQIGTLLGRGQSSLVFRAQDLKTNQTVALKVLSPDFPANDAELQRFVRALKIVPHLQHPHLVHIHGAGKSGAYCWISREYVDGESLARLVTRLGQGAKPDWARACRVGVQLGKTLVFLHQHRMTHGHVTPRNVLVARSDKATKLTDLLLHEALLGSELQKTIWPNKLLTELPYRAPEQVDLRSRATPLGDLYAVGAVLYALLTGQPPYNGDSPKEILAQMREKKVEKPTRFCPDIPAPLESAVLKAMAHGPASRFPTAAELVAALELVAKKCDVKL
jgi:serine/threonine-protein kinase